MNNATHDPVYRQRFRVRSLGSDEVVLESLAEDGVMTSIVIVRRSLNSAASAAFDHALGDVGSTVTFSLERQP